MPKSLRSIVVIVLILAGIAGFLSAREASGVLLAAILIPIGLAAGYLAQAVQSEPESDETTTLSGPEAKPDNLLKNRLIEALPAAILVLDRAGMIIRANDAAQAMMPRLDIGRHLTNLMRGPAVLKAVEACVSDGIDSTVEVTLHGTRDSHLTARVCGFDRRDGHPPGEILLMVEDQTAAHQLARSRSDFVANAGHEMRTPLASIIGYIETLQGVAEDDPEARRRFLDIMDKQAHRMQRLIENMTSLTRIELDERIPLDSECNMFEAAQEAASALAPLAERQGAALDVDLPKSDAPTPGDRDQLISVFVNLIENALKYGGPGVSIMLRAARDEPPMPGLTGIEVVDTGPGIARDEIPRLTERFFRSSTLKSTDASGSGLGLAIVKHILNRHGGMLRIHSPEEGGSRFTVWLPSASRAPS